MPDDVLAQAPAPAPLAPLLALAGRAVEPSTDLADALALARATAAGDRGAARAFARRLLPVARRVTRALLGAGGEADDACQNALVELLESARTYAGQGPLEAWARRIAVRVAMRTLRRRPAAVPLEEVDLPDAPPLEDLREQLPRGLQDYLGRLPENQRVALVLRHALDHTLPEIAEICGAPVPTIKSRILKAEETLRKLIRRDLNLGASSAGGPP